MCSAHHATNIDLISIHTLVLALLNVMHMCTQSVLGKSSLNTKTSLLETFVQHIWSHTVPPTACGVTLPTRMFELLDTVSKSKEELFPIFHGALLQQ